MGTINDFLTSAEVIYGSEFEIYIPLFFNHADQSHFPNTEKELIGKA